MKESTIRIGYDAKRLFLNAYGLGRYSRTLIEAILLHWPDVELHLYTPKVVRNEMTADIMDQPNVRVHTTNRTSWWWRTVGIMDDLVQHKIDIFHGLSGELPIGLHRTNIKSVVTIHDCIFDIYPQYYSLINRQIYRWKTKNAIQAADRIVSVSEQTKVDMIRLYRGVSVEKIQTIYPTVPEIKMLNKQKEDYILFIGNSNPRKNLITVLKAMHLLYQEGVKAALLIIGSPSPSEERYIDTHKELDIRTEQDISHKQLFQYLEKAKGLIYPSLYEGFGIPIVEALHLGTPVIVSQGRGMAEAIGKYGLLLSDPQDEMDVAAKIKHLYDGDQIKIAQGVSAHLEQFSPANIAACYVDLYKNLKGD